MKPKKLQSLKLILLIVSSIFLYAFTNSKNKKRIVSKPNISFLGSSHLYLTQEDVSKLLIQNQKELTNTSKEALDLNHLEMALKSNPMVRTAEVYITVNGKLNVEIEQKKPIARVISSPSYYISNEGNYMPLSQNYAARVPLVTGKVDKTDLKPAFFVANKIAEDAFLSKHVIEIHQKKNKNIVLKLRQCPFVVNIGSIKNFDKKINNLKVFYKKALKDKIKNKYRTINLQFENQVVCTKA